MKSLYFASNNYDKYVEIQPVLQKYSIDVHFSRMKLTEIQSTFLIEIAIEKSKSAFEKISMPIIVEDDGLYIDEPMVFLVNILLTSLRLLAMTEY